MSREARLEQTDHGRVAASDGWFVVNVRNAAWVTNKRFGDACIFEGDAVPFAQVGYTIGVVWPGKSSGLYHAEEDTQEDFLVLAGECLLLVEGEERSLRAWDFVHCPPGTEHIFVGAGSGPCVIFMTGYRTADRRIVYPRSELALEHGAGVETETRSPAEAYAPFPKWTPGPPASWAGLPWDDV
jgi:uncharacterized cupin superfamily protein